MTVDINTLQRGDKVILPNGQIVKINSIDRKHGMIDWVLELGRDWEDLAEVHVSQITLA